MVHPMPYFSSVVRTSEIQAARSLGKAALRYTPNSLHVSGTFQRFPQAAIWEISSSIRSTLQRSMPYRMTRRRFTTSRTKDRKSVVKGKIVDLRARRIIKKKKGRHQWAPSDSKNKPNTHT